MATFLPHASADAHVHHLAECDDKWNDSGTTVGATTTEAATTLAATPAANTTANTTGGTTAGATTTEAATTLAATTAVVSLHAGNHLHGVLPVHRL